MKTMWGPCGNHMKTMWGGSVLVVPNPISQDRPNQGFQMKFGRLANTWSSKNATFRGDIICYINLFYTCMVCMFLLKFM